MIIVPSTCRIRHIILLTARYGFTGNCSDMEMIYQLCALVVLYPKMQTPAVRAASPIMNLISSSAVVL